MNFPEGLEEIFPVHAQTKDAITDSEFVWSPNILSCMCCIERLRSLCMNVCMCREVCQIIDSILFVLLQFFTNSVQGGQTQIADFCPFENVSHAVPCHTARFNLISPTCMHIHTHTHTHMRTHMRTHTQTCLQTHKCTHTSTHTPTNTYIHAHTCILYKHTHKHTPNTHMHTHLQTHTHIHSDTHTHAHTHTKHIDAHTPTNTHMHTSKTPNTHMHMHTNTHIYQHTLTQTFTILEQDGTVRGTDCNMIANQPSTNVLLESYGTGSRCIRHGTRQWTNSQFTGFSVGSGCYQVSH